VGVLDYDLENELFLVKFLNNGAILKEISIKPEEAECRFSFVSRKSVTLNNFQRVDDELELFQETY